MPGKCQRVRSGPFSDSGNLHLVLLRQNGNRMWRVRFHQDGPILVLKIEEEVQHVKLPRIELYATSKQKERGVSAPGATNLKWR